MGGDCVDFKPVVALGGWHKEVHSGHAEPSSDRGCWRQGIVAAAGLRESLRCTLAMGEVGQWSRLSPSMA